MCVRHTEREKQLIFTQMVERFHSEFFIPEQQNAVLLSGCQDVTRMTKLQGTHWEVQPKLQAQNRNGSGPDHTILELVLLYRDLQLSSVVAPAV